MGLERAVLASLRQLGDPRAEAVIDSLPARLHDPRALLSRLPSRRGDAVVDLPDTLEAFLADHAPPSVDLDRVARAERLFFEWGDSCLAVAAAWALPLFLGSVGRSGLLQGLAGEERAAGARALELLQALVDLMCPDGFAGRSSRSRGVRAIQRLRLGWALDRRRLLEAGWDTATDGLPLSQTDLAMLVLTLMRLPGQPLGMVGIAVSAEDEEGWRATWAEIGAALGIDSRLLPTDREEVDALWEQLLALVAHEQSQAPQLVSSYVEHLERILPGTVLDGVSAPLMAHLLGEEQARAMGLQTEGFEELIELTYAMLHGGGRGLATSSHRQREVVERYGQALVEGLSMTLRPLSGRPFHVPRTLRVNWSTQAALRGLSELDTARQSALPPSDEHGLLLDDPDTVLDDARTRGDPEADFLMEKLAPAAAHRPPSAADRAQRAALNGMLRKLVINPYDDEGLPPELLQFRDSISALPPWTDPDQIAIAGEFFADHGSKCIGVLLTYGLPVGYGAAKGAKVLTSTKRLSYPTTITRRIAETAQMVIDVLTPGGLEPGGAGINTCMRVRLMHAMIRQSLLNHTEQPWNTPALGIPINQEDMLATSLCFSFCTLDAFDRLGIDYGEDLADRDRKREAWIHLWRVVGALMGCDDTLLPKSFEESRALWTAIYRRQVMPSITDGNPDGAELTQALVGMLDDILPPVVQELPPGLMRELLGDPLATALGVPETAVGTVLAQATRLFWDASDETGVAMDAMGRAMDRLSVHLVKALLRDLNLRGGRRAPFQIPDHFRVRWEGQSRLERWRGRLGTLLG